MTQIDFYLQAPDRLQIACRLIVKAYAAKNRVLVYAPDEPVARALDRLLWTTPAIGFVPHCMAHDPLAAETPVLIAREGEAPGQDDVLLNLHHEWPPFFPRFQRLLEIVGPEEDDKSAARARFRAYRDRGYAIRTHDLARGE
ncbi:MAG: DNA polymerase III subunit chi [Burkholderiales bacterium]|jgi:DNA polymerase-3 subunit chi|nr:DNA polymerase III subunit chi [Burkholderiales bacterium]